MPLSAYLFGINPQNTVVSSTIGEIEVTVESLEIDVEVELQ